MPSCSIKQFGARRNDNHPTLTLHRFPVNEVLRRKLIKIIGLENINLRHKMWHVCSIHFHESSFNRTLDMIRLRDCAVPLSSLLADQISSNTMLDSPTSSAMKSRDGLQYASAAVVNIIKKTEKLIKPNLTSQTKPEN